MKQSFSRRKLNKLVRDPRRFAFDYFKKRLAASDEVSLNGSATPRPLDPNARRDFSTDLSEEFETLVRALWEHNVVVQVMPGDFPHIRRLVVKSGDFDYVVTTMQSVDLSPLRLRFEGLEGDRRGIVTAHFSDGVTDFLNPTIELDPWRHQNGRIRSLNPNPLLCTIPDEYINQTVFALHAPTLGGEQFDLSRLSFAKQLGLRPELLHSVDFPVDVVYTWVDDTDPAWNARKQETTSQLKGQINSADVSASRFRNRDELRYSLRSVDAYLKCARQIIIVTDRQVPYWLDRDHPKIRIVDHAEIFPSKAHLPSFNSHAIESNLFRIPGLSEQFIYMNDDIFFLNPCRELDFFHCNGIGKSFYEDFANVYGEVTPESPAFRNAAINGGKLIEARSGRTPRTYHLHTPHALRRSVLERLWVEFPEPLERTSAAQLRSPTDVSPVSFLYHAFAILEGATVPGELPAAYVSLGDKGLEKRLDDLLADPVTKAVCINDVPGGDESTRDRLLLRFLNQRLSVASEWELDR